MSVQKLNIVDIDLNSGNIHRSWNLHSIGKADNKANAFGVRVFRDGAEESLSDVSVQGYFRDPQGNNIAITTGNTVSGNIAYVVLPQACYNYEGQYCLAIKLIGGGITGTVRIVDGMVDNTNTGGAVAPTETVPTYQEILATYGDMVDIVEDYEEVVATQNGQISDLKSAITTNLIPNEFSWERGGINGTTGANDNNATYRGRNPSIIQASKKIVLVMASSSYKFTVFRYDSEGNFLSNTGWVTSNEHEIEAGTHFRIQLAKYVEDWQAINFNLDEAVASLKIKLQSAIDIEILQDEMETVNSNFEALAIFKNNYFKPSDALDGYFYDGNVNDTISANANANYACIIFPVEQGKTYVLERTDYRWNELDENNKILERHGSSVAATSLSITPNKTGVKKVAFSWQKSYVPISSYMILDPGVSFSTYVQYPRTAILNGATIEAYGIAQKGKVYTVGTGGDFTTFSAMLVALKDDTSEKTVYVKTGVYDIFTEIGGQTYMESIDTSDSWTVVNNVVPQNTKIIGIGDVVLQFKPTDTQIVDYTHGWLMSPLNIVGSCEIENIAIDCSNCRYAIHIESATGEMDGNTAKVVLRNVRANRAVTSLMGDHQTVGTGIGHNARWTFEDCRFTSDGTSAIFSVHTNAPAINSKAVVMLKDCVITSSHNNANSSKLVNFISQYLPVAITEIVNVSNCYVNGKIGTETSITNRQAFDIDVIGGANYGFADSSTQTSGYTINNCGANILS